MMEDNVSGRVTLIIDKAGFIRVIDKEDDVYTHAKAVLQMLQEHLPKPIKVGNPAPDFTLSAHDGKSYTLSQFRDKKNVVLAFYPKDFTGG